MTWRYVQVVGGGLAVLLGAVAGAAVGLALARHAQERAGYARLDNYSLRQMAAAERIGEDTAGAIRAVRADGLPLCSDAELAFLRKTVYNSANVRDIAREEDGKLVCAAGIGRLPEPVPITPPPYDVDGLMIYPHLKLKLSPDTSGFMVETAGVSVVLNPSAYGNLDEPPMVHANWMYVPSHRLLLFAFGHSMPLSEAEITGERFVRRDGVVYRTRCSASSKACIAAAEPLADMMTRTRGIVPRYVVMNGLLGMAIALIVVLLVRTQRSQSAQLLRAVRHGKLRVLYQPIYELNVDALREGRPGRLEGAEALVRWTNESGEEMPAETMMALAAKGGFMREITRSVVRTALAELGDVLRKCDVHLSVNICAQDLLDESFPEFLATEVLKAGVLPSCLALELTEKSAVQEEGSIEALRRLKQSGHVIYIDDFGTGYSSLAYLHTMAVDAIKIDRVFTHTVGTQAAAASVVPQILAMAREMQLLVVVEGIETREQADYFAAVGGLRMLGQGWFFGRAMTAEKLKERMERP